MLRIVVDMNLSTGWVSVLTDAGYSVVHWSAVGPVEALDPDIMAWAKANGHLILTHDLDYGTLLALSGADGPSVVLIRSKVPFPDILGSAVVTAIENNEVELEEGAIVIVEPAGARVRTLPINL